MFAAVGYSPYQLEVVLQRWDTVEVDIALEHPRIVLDTIRVTAENVELLGNRNLIAVGFAERRAYARATALRSTFYTPADILNRRPARLSHLVADARGLHMYYEGLKAVPLGSGCTMSVWLDGAEVSVVGNRQGMGGVRSISGGGTGARGPEDPLGLDFIPINQVAAVEVYPSPAVTPAQFQSLRSPCGAIVIWTKT
jgi:hypothetical protein